MKLKFYLRGIGIGILVSAAIFISSGMDKKSVSMTDAEIKERAAALGMVEDKTVLSDMGDEKAKLDAVVKPTVESAKPQPTVAPTAEAAKPTGKAEVAPTAETAKPTEAVAEPTAKATAEPTASEGKVVFVINKGNGSDTVARKLYEAGLVENAGDYDKWLIANGYDRRISAGTFEIPKGASEAEIANIISGRR